MIIRLLGLTAALTLAAGCASHRRPEPAAAPAPAAPPVSAAPKTPPTPETPQPPVAAVPTDSTRPPANPGGATPQPMAPPALAYRRGWMALDATGVSEFRQAHPTDDGRGVVIGILDSGIDPGVPGLQTTTTGSPKLVDLRDFSGEGRIALQRLTPRGDTLQVGNRRLLGAGRVLALAGSGPVYGGTLAEIGLGPAPAADLDGDGAASDTLPVVVAHASDGWVLFVDADQNGSLANDRPIHDYLRARETFGWSVAGRPAPVTLAANFSDGACPECQRGDTPTLDLFFDTSSHGTHVAGIAAGHDIYGVKGFDGVAPGAQLLGLKIANDAQGGITVTGSMLRAIDYAIGFAAARHLPLVLNMSFGVGNEIEGSAVIDAAIDSVLARHPELVFSISAGNDGPGLSTIGFPGSASRALTVGALFPSVFLAPGSGAPPGTASFSSRGGELAKPDLLAPGIAYSTVPRWDTGKEVKTGTSMAAPHAAGLAALLIGASSRDSSTRRQPVEARRIRQALMVTAQPTPGATYLDEGTGIPNVQRALRWLSSGRSVPEVRVRAAEGVTAAYTVGSTRDSTRHFELTGGPGAAGTYTLRSDSRWLVAPKTVTLGATPAKITLLTSSVPRDSVRVGVVSGWGADTTAGPAFRLVVAEASAEPSGRDISLKTGAVAPNRVARFFVNADSARPFSVRVATGAGQAALAYLHEPHGMPFREEAGRPAGSGHEAAVYHVDGRDVRRGVYEVDVVAPPTQGTAADVAVRHSPFTIDAVRSSEGVTATLTNVSALPAKAAVAAVVAGAERQEHISETTSAPRRVPLEIPAWAKAVVIDVRMDPAQWSRFTDFGVTLFDSAGRQLAQSPLNYAIGRVQAELPPHHGPIHAAVGLFPGFAEPGDERWAVDLSLKVYADSAAPLEPRGTPATAVEAGRRATVGFSPPAPPWPMGAGFAPLTVFVLDVAGETWTREVRLSSPSPATR